MKTDYDVVVVGSGFGGSVAALRAAEKGYRVLVLEAGARFADDDFAKTNWDVRRYLWAPKLKCFGVQRIHKLPDVMLLAGAGVGGGSLNYANTLYVPPKAFFEDHQWAGITDWEDELAPHYATASRMLGVVVNEVEGPAEEAMRSAADAMGVGASFRKTPVGVYFGKPGVTQPDPYFDGAGPERTGCTLCGNCMVGCRVGAKNTLVKNYLALAERLGVVIEPLRTVVDLRPVDAGGGGPTAYEIVSERSGAWVRRDRRTVVAGEVVIAAGTWGTQQLLHGLKATGRLPRLSSRLGELTRTNSEALLGANLPRVEPGADLSEGIAITSSFHPDAETHVENVRYGRGSNSMGLLTSLLIPGDTGRTRLGELARQIRRDPSRLKEFRVRKWSQRTIIALVMQTRDNSLTVSGKPRRLTRGVRLTSRQGHGEPNPSWIPAGHAAARALAAALQRHTGQAATAGGNWAENLGFPLTAHFLGGAVIGATPDEGVIDPYHRVWGYPGLHITDGAAISANLGVNPSLTITAQAERALSLWPRKGESERRPPQGGAYVRLDVAVR
ncbi:MAG: GMC family oxidoreductase [Tetrasphaera sp.]